MKIGIFGGSFNPVHTGHMMVANYCAQFCGLDKVWLMVSPQNPLKEGVEMVSESQRLEMCNIAARFCNNVECSDFEFGLKRPSYTYLTLSELRKQFPKHQFSLIIGADNWALFNRWRDYEKIISEFSVIIYPRPGYKVENIPDGDITVISDLEAPVALISSTFVRKVLAKGANPNYFIPICVAEYIKNNHLYEPEM